MISPKYSQSALGPLGWRHCKNAIPKHLIQHIKKELSELMTSLGAPKKGAFFCGIDQQAKAFSNDISSFQIALQKSLHRLPSVYELALSREIKHILEVNTGWNESELSPIHNIRVKYPHRYGISPFTTVPWHQDYGATDPCQSNLKIVTAWIPLTSSNAHSGGIEIIPRSTQLGWIEHRRGNRGPEVKDEILKKVLKENSDFQPVKIQTNLGDVILFDQYTLHRSLINLSNQLRWSIDMRYILKGSESGRPGIWSRNPIVGKFIKTEVMTLVKQRQDSMKNPEVTIKKRVDHHSSAEI